MFLSCAVKQALYECLCNYHDRSKNRERNRFGKSKHGHDYSSQTKNTM